MRIASRFKGNCNECGMPYKAGDLIEWDPDAPSGANTFHWNCHDRLIERDKVEAERAAHTKLDALGWQK